MSSILRVVTLDYFYLSSMLNSQMWVAKFSFEQKSLIFTFKIGTVKIAKHWIQPPMQQCTDPWHLCNKTYFLHALIWNFSCLLNTPWTVQLQSLGLIKWLIWKIQSVSIWHVSVPKRMVCSLTCSQNVDPHTSFTQRYVH